MDGVNQIGRKPFEATIKVDGSTWFEGKASSVLLGNVGELFAGVEAFEGASPDDGMLDLGVVTADSALEWARTIARTAVGASGASPFVRVTKARSAEVKFDRKILYELDGGERTKVKKLDVEVEPGAITVCVPRGEQVSTAAKVPETWELTGDDARKTLLGTGRRQLLKDSFVRLRAADGFSHSRSLAFVTSLVLVQGLIALVGFAAAFGDVRMSREIVAAIESAIPGPAGEVLTNAVEQAREVGSNRRYLPLLLGLLGTLVTGTTAMGQIERGFNRIYGIE